MPIFVEPQDCDMHVYTCLPCEPSRAAVSPYHVWWSGGVCETAPGETTGVCQYTLVLQVNTEYASARSYYDIWKSMHGPTYENVLFRQPGTKHTRQCLERGQALSPE